MAKVGRFSEAKTVDGKIEHSIEENINGYYTYFQ
jgi:hypothetical protein